MTWQPRDKDFKSYPHFDKKISRKKLINFATNDYCVTRHSFYPLMLFHEKWVKFRKYGKVQKKSRPLRYAARLDAAIYAYHRHCLSSYYEAELKRRNIADVPIAYRKIPRSDGAGNKNNIEFARDAFDFIRECGSVDVTIADVSSFFESLDHKKLQIRWELMLGRELSKAEFAVFKNLTNYSTVNKNEVFERLALHEKGSGNNRNEKRQRKIDQMRRKGHKQICSAKEFRNLICGADPKFPSLIQRNTSKKGIPQGTPISDLIANIYMIDFDRKLARWVTQKGGRAFRYSDDIIVILPRRNGQPFDLAMNYLRKHFPDRETQSKIASDEIHSTTEFPLELQTTKVAVGRFLKTAEGQQVYTHIVGNSCQNGIEYLGFEFDGKSVRLRNSTLSNAWRKLKKRSYGWARRYVRRYREKGRAYLINNAPLKYESERIVKVASPKVRDKNMWTFMRYVKRCEIAFSEYDVQFSKQTLRYRRVAEEIIMKAAFRKAMRKHYKPRKSSKSTP